MPVIKLQDDPGLYRVELPALNGAERAIELNVFSLGHALRNAAPGAESFTDAQVVAAVRAIGRPGEAMSAPDHELFAAGMAVLTHSQRLGNVLGPPPT